MTDRQKIHIYADTGGVVLSNAAVKSTPHGRAAPSKMVLTCNNTYLLIIDKVSK